MPRKFARHDRKHGDDKILGSIERDSILVGGHFDRQTLRIILGLEEESGTGQQWKIELIGVQVARFLLAQPVKRIGGRAADGDIPANDFSPNVFGRLPPQTGVAEDAILED